MLNMGRLRLGVWSSCLEGDAFPGGQISLLYSTLRISNCERSLSLLSLLQSCKSTSLPLWCSHHFTIMLDNAWECDVKSLVVLIQTSVYSSIMKEILFSETREWPSSPQKSTDKSLWWNVWHWRLKYIVFISRSLWLFQMTHLIK